VKKFILQSDVLNVQIKALEGDIVALTSLNVVQHDEEVAELLCDAFLTSFHKRLLFNS
jgi:hypothetical protein